MNCSAGGSPELKFERVGVPRTRMLGIAPLASTQDDAVIQVRGGGHGYGHHGWHGGRGHHYGWYRGRGNWRHRH